MIRTAAKIFGAVFILIGILGFIPAFTPENRLLGIFEVNALHNVIHLASGVVALLAAFGNARSARLYFQVFGIVYGLVAVLGFFYGDQPLLGIVAHNMADTWLHVVITISALYLGFVAKDDGTPAPAAEV